MNRNGFTLIELLVVLAIVSIASAGSILVFDRADAENNKKDIKTNYVKIQRAAMTYLEMDDSWRSQFNTKGYMYININELQNDNYIDEDVIIASKLKGENYVFAYIDGDAVDTCIVNSTELGFQCVSNAYGYAYDCCLNAKPGFVYNVAKGNEKSVDESYLFDE
jgi:prepilin-type N-terminal cleavage/methylation domain-containing protein